MASGPITLWKIDKETMETVIKYADFKKINPKYTLEGLMLRLKLQYLGHMT